MKFNGQSLAEIFQKMPWPYKIVSGAGALFILYAAITVPSRISHVSLPSTGPTTLHITSTPKGETGMLDPSLAYDPVKKTMWMAYTSFSQAPKAAEGDASLMNIRLATSATEGCDTWSYQKAGGLSGKLDSLIAPDGKTVFRTGMWRFETPSLVYDPDDKGREWKLFAYKYFWPEGDVAPETIAERYGVITYTSASASDPVKGWTTERWLFAAAPGYPPPPYQAAILLHLSRLDKSLADVVSYARPSVIYKSGSLLMTLSAYTRGLNLDRIVMIASADHGNSWRYVGVPLRTAEIAAAGLDVGKALFGATVFEQDGKAYLAALVGGSQFVGPRAVAVFAFDDLTKGTLTRDPKTGKPVVVRQLPLPNPQLRSGGGLAYHDACKGGYMMAGQSRGKNAFSIFLDKEKPIPPPPATEGKKP